MPPDPQVWTFFSCVHLQDLTLQYAPDIIQSLYSIYYLQNNHHHIPLIPTS